MFLRRGIKVNVMLVEVFPIKKTNLSRLSIMTSHLLELTLKLCNFLIADSVLWNAHYTCTVYSTLPRNACIAFYFFTTSKAAELSE